MNDFWQQKKVLVLGGTGLIGKQMVKTLIARGAQVTFTSRKKQKSANAEFQQLNPADYKDLSNLNGNFEVLINCAALDGNGYFKKQFAGEVCDTNTRIALNVLLFVKTKQIKDCVLFSSAEIYSTLKKKLVKESDFQNVNIDVSQGYQTAKFILEMLTSFYRNTNDQLRLYLPRPSYVYGPGDKFIDDQNSRLIPLLIHKIANNQKMTFFGGRSKLLNMVYVEDLVDSVLKMVEKRKTGPLNITSSERVRIDKIIQTIADELGKKPKIDYQKSNLRPGFLLSNEELLKIKTDFISFKEGIKKTLN